jgi:UDP-N-acetylglucosamine--N-acetylmuramyl-(pentapeptide) pyrophosphoryl-undecaprenol N-acetylglucosamine transferase
MRDLSVIFAGGGTGGHIYPAIAIAEALLSHDPSISCTWCVSTRPLDAAILRETVVGDHSVSFTPIPAQPFGLRPRPLMKFLASWGWAVRSARAEITRSQAGARQVVLVAMGGFVAAPCAQAARAEKIPLLLVNLDAIPGKANRWIAKRADVIRSAAPVDPRVGWTITPPIVRAAALQRPSIDDAKRALAIDPASPVLLITGGSQGAGSINNLMIALAQHHADAFRGWHILHQTGKDGADRVRAAYSGAGLRATVAEFVPNLANWWHASDAAVARSGAGNVAEVWATTTPTVFLPYPHHKDQHQKFNAQPLVDAGGAILAMDKIEPHANLEGEAGRAVLSILAQSTRRDAMRQALANLGPANGAACVAAEILKLGNPTAQTRNHTRNRANLAHSPTPGS